VCKPRFCNYNAINSVIPASLLLRTRSKFSRTRTSCSLMMRWQIKSTCKRQLYPQYVQKNHKIIKTVKWWPLISFCVIHLKNPEQLRLRTRITHYSFSVLTFNALTLLVKQRKDHLACKKLNAGIVICLEWGANDLHMVQLMPLPPHHLLLH